MVIALTCSLYPTHRAYLLACSFELLNIIASPRLHIVVVVLIVVVISATSRSALY